MNQSQLVQMNIENLTAFWSACGVHRIPAPDGSTLHKSINWPNRMWFGFEDYPQDQDISCLIKHTEEAGGEFKIPNWHVADDRMHNALLNAGHEIGMTQELMALDLDQMAEQPSLALTLKKVTDQESSSLWASIAGESFGYYIHEPVITGLLRLPGFEFVVVYDNETAVGTGMLLKTEEIAGIHMIGVPPSQRRKGYARQIMYGLLARAKELGCKYSTLQASAAGEPLYHQLGYFSQGPIHTYRKKKIQ